MVTMVRALSDISAKVCRSEQRLARKIYKMRHWDVRRSGIGENAPLSSVRRHGVLLI
jgi:hypothetical protein